MTNSITQQQHQVPLLLRLIRPGTPTGLSRTSAIRRTTTSSTAEAVGRITIPETSAIGNGSKIARSSTSIPSASTSPSWRSTLSKSGGRRVPPAGSSRWTTRPGSGTTSVIRRPGRRPARPCERRRLRSDGSWRRRPPAAHILQAR